MSSTTTNAITNNPQGKIKHVIIVVQENRTPDNLFFADNVLVANGGNVRPPGNPPYGLCTILPPDSPHTYQIPLTGMELDPCFDPMHFHADWTASYHNGAMDGACYVRLKYAQNGCTVPDCQVPLPEGRKCVEYSYVSFPVSMATYFDIAHKYGFANYFFQNNQGPSYPAHQFLFGGTSLPVPFSQDQNRFKWFAADNPTQPNGTNAASCISPPGAKVSLVKTDSTWPDCAQYPNDPQCIFPCLEHKTMADLFGTSVSWKYYINDSGKLWDAPAAVGHVCLNPSEQNASSCDNPTYTSHVVLPNGDHARILSDIETNCTLANVSWVIPDGKWSDHAGRNQDGLNINHDGGPSWVGRIVNAVGNSTCTDTINGQPTSYWNDTVILVVWDDWGGWYDHVSPDKSVGGPGPGYGQQQQNSGWYVYGFRVPFLVISAYNKHNPGSQGYNGYVSGGPSGPSCPGVACHDFGSILNFVEFVFGSNGGFLGTLSDQHSDYADALAADGPNICGSQTCPYSLSDFFNFDNSPNAFNPITGMKYAETCFHNPNQTGCWPNAPDEDPDDDAYEN